MGSALTLVIFLRAKLAFCVTRTRSGCTTSRRQPARTRYWEALGSVWPIGSRIRQGTACAVALCRSTMQAQPLDRPACKRRPQGDSNPCYRRERVGHALHVVLALIAHIIRSCYH